MSGGFKRNSELFHDQRGIKVSVSLLKSDYALVHAMSLRQEPRTLSPREIRGLVVRTIQLSASCPSLILVIRGCPGGPNLVRNIKGKSGDQSREYGGYERAFLPRAIKVAAHPFAMLNGSAPPSQVVPERFVEV